MPWHELIFSEENKYKLCRHLAFWASWWLYFLVCSAASGIATFLYRKSPTVRTVGALTGFSTFVFFVATLLSPTAP